MNICIVYANELLEERERFSLVTFTQRSEYVTLQQLALKEQSTTDFLPHLARPSILHNRISRAFSVRQGGPRLSHDVCTHPHGNWNKHLYWAMPGDTSTFSYHTSFRTMLSRSSTTNACVDQTQCTQASLVDDKKEGERKIVSIRFSTSFASVV